MQWRSRAIPCVEYYQGIGENSGRIASMGKCHWIQTSTLWERPNLDTSGKSKRAHTPWELLLQAVQGVFTVPTYTFFRIIPHVISRRITNGCNNRISNIILPCPVLVVGSKYIQNIKIYTGVLAFLSELNSHMDRKVGAERCNSIDFHGRRPNFITWSN